jgi:hypothetical protein
MGVAINLTRGYGYRTSILHCLIVLLGECDSMAVVVDTGGVNRLPPRWWVVNLLTRNGYLMTVVTSH